MSRSIVTKTGDAGQTKLIYGTAVSKADLRVEAYGTIDELNSFLGLARALCADTQIKVILEAIQRESFTLSTELATPQEQLHKLKVRITPEMTKVLEDHIAPIEARPGLLDDWALPGAITASAALDVARTVCRRAERCVVRLHEAGELSNGEILRYLNRLSDLLWLLGRRGVEGALRLVRLHEEGELPNGEILRYLNRLSDLLWLLGRKCEMDNGVEGALRA